MLFNSWQFLAFFVVVLALYQRIGHRAQNAMLLVASYVFYGWWDWRFLGLLALSTTVDFVCARGIHGSDDQSVRRRLLWLSVTTNLGILGFFKYFDFFRESAVAALAALGVRVSAPMLDVVLPVGISFYTFQTMAYTIDVYRGETRPAARFLDFALYVAFFPQLVAGPIERARTLLPQIERPRRVGGDDWAAALQLLLLGYFKKVCIADSVAPEVDHAFAHPGALAASELWMALYLFAVQIYGDFSGYTDVARGVARLLGIRLSVNFRQPYFSTSITEFWRRWHVSLSTWLRDYLYVPLGGNRHGRWRTYRNLLVTMVLGGLWHGASWHFVAWGGLHGLALALHRAWTGHTVSRPPAEGRTHPVARAAKILLTFHGVCLLWVLFRADSLAASWQYALGLVGPFGAPPTDLALATAGYLALVALVDWPCWRRDDELPVGADWPAWARGLAFATLAVALSFVGESNVRPFIYFQF